MQLGATQARSWKLELQRHVKTTAVIRGPWARSFNEQIVSRGK